MLAAFEEAGLAESHRDWLQGNFFGGKPGPTEGDQCAGAQGPFEHDQNGEEVDGGDYELIDNDTVSFPSHADEFDYQGDILADFAVNGDVVTFKVALP